MIQVGKYKLCVLDLITDDKTGKLSGTKIWNNIANIILSKAVLTATVTWELLAAYGAVVGGSHVATMFIKYRYRDTQDRDNYQYRDAREYQNVDDPR